MKIAWKSPALTVEQPLVGQGAGGCQATSTSLQAIPFSVTETVTLLSCFGDVCQELRRNILHKGLKCTFKTRFDLPQAAVHWSPVKVHAKGRHLPHLPFHDGKKICSLFSHIASAEGNWPFVPKEHASHVQLYFALRSGHVKAEHNCPASPLSYLLCRNYTSSTCPAPTFSFPSLVFWFLGHSFTRVTLTSFAREGKVFSD